MSVVVALLVGGIEALGLVGRPTRPDRTRFWDGSAHLNENFGALGYLIVGIFVVSWLLSVAIYRWRGYDEIELTA